MSEVTAADLLAKQATVQYLQGSAQLAFNAISAAERAVDAARDTYNEARWRAEDAAAELAEMERAILAEPAS